MLSTSDLRKGLKYLKDGEPHVIVDFQFVKPGKGQALYKCKLRNLITGSIYELTYRSGESFEEANVEERRMQYLFQEDDRYCFMDNSTYDQIYVPAEAMGEDALYLTDNIEVDVLMWGEKPIGVTLPNFVELQITECEPGVRGDTATGATKIATLSTGATVYVPLFVEQEEWIKIDTRTRAYVERVKK
ncbi:MAG: elongation factor P [Polyangia bacterium]|jgi:elongation factor P|nr:elongation factor P [Polyangia bacterium]